MNAIQTIINFRNNYHTRDDLELLTLLRDAKEKAKKANDNEGYAQALFWMRVFKAQQHFLASFDNCKNKKFYDGWCDLQKGLDCLSNDEEVQISGIEDPCSIKFIRNYFCKVQDLYPYSVFGSPEFTYRRKCTICNQLVKFRRKCEHIPGKIYKGVVCRYVPTEFEFLAMAIVSNPVQKYSVFFAVDKETKKPFDHHNYGPLELLFQGISNPFEFWSYTREKRTYPKKHFVNYDLGDDCPCGSGKNFKECCLALKNITVPHIQFEFSPEAQIRLAKFPPQIARKIRGTVSDTFQIVIFAVSDKDLF